MSSGIAVGEFEALAGLVLTLAMIFVGWNARHERWFRDYFFPHYRDYYGNDDDGTDDGHKETIDDRVQRVENISREAKEEAEGTREEIGGLRDDVGELTDHVQEHNERERRLLRRLVFTLDRRDMVDITEVADEDDFLRGGNSSGDAEFSFDGGQPRSGDD